MCDSDRGISITQDSQGGRVSCVIVVNIDIHHSVVIVASDSFDVKEERTIPLGISSSPAVAIRAIRLIVASAIKRLDSEIELRGLGVSFPGSVDVTTGLILFCQYGDWIGVDLSQIANQSGQFPIIFESSGGASLIAECDVLGEGIRYAVGIFVGDSVEGAVVIEGKLFRGAHGLIGLFGHFPVDHSNRAIRCRCGHLGHLEMYASSSALQQLLADKGFANESADWRPSLSAAASAARSGGSDADAIFAQTALRLRHAVTQYIMMDMAQIYLVIGGDVERATDGILAEYMSKLLVSMTRVQVVKANLGASAPALGITRLLLDRLDNSGPS